MKTQTKKFDEDNLEELNLDSWYKKWIIHRHQKQMAEILDKAINRK